MEESCEVTAATPVNATPTAAMAAPAANEPATGCPLAIIARASSGASTTFAASATTTAAARLAAEPDDAGPQELVAASLLALPRVPHHGEDAHHRGQDGQRQVAPAHRVGADARACGEAEQAHAGVARP